MTDLISKTSLIEWVKDILLGVKKAYEEHSKTLVSSMPNDELLDALELSYEFEPKIEILQEAIKLIEGYTPTASLATPAPDASKNDFKRLESAFLAYLDAREKYALASADYMTWQKSHPQPIAPHRIDDYEVFSDFREKAREWFEMRDAQLKYVLFVEMEGEEAKEALQEVVTLENIPSQAVLKIGNYGVAILRGQWNQSGNSYVHLKYASWEKASTVARDDINLKLDWLTIELV